MRRLLLVLPALFLLVLSSCKDSDAQAKIDRLDSKVQSLEQRVNNASTTSDLEALRSRVDNLAQQIAQMKEATQPKMNEFENSGGPSARDLAKFVPADLGNIKAYSKYRLEVDTSQGNLTFYLKDKETSDLALFGQIVYQGDKPDTFFKNYSKQRVLGYPGKISKNQWVQVLAGKFEVRVEASEEIKDFKKTAKLTSFLRLIDLKGLKSYK